MITILIAIVLIVSLIFHLLAWLLSWRKKYKDKKLETVRLLTLAGYMQMLFISAIDLNTLVYWVFVIGLLVLETIHITMHVMARYYNIDLRGE